LLKDPDKPLLNRATQGQYPTGAIMQPFINAAELNGSANDKNVFKTFGFLQAPQIQLPVTAVSVKDTAGTFRISPLQMALATAALSNHGIVPAPRIAMAVNTPTEGWVPLPALGKPLEALRASAADEAASAYLVDNQAYWQSVAVAKEDQSSVTWFIGGTPPNWQATPLAIVVVLEEGNDSLAKRIGMELLMDAMHP
jgi:hypothetical protein